MDSDPNAPDILDKSPSQGEPKPRERYNTNYIVDNFTRAERRNRMIVAALAAALMLALGVGLLLHGGHPPAQAPTAGDAPPEASAPQPAER